MASQGILFWFIVAALIAVAAVLVLGVVSMFRGGAFNRKYGNILMRWRVGLQALAVALLFLLWLIGKN